jgi:putative Holliday junction resolvase
MGKRWSRGRRRERGSTKRRPLLAGRPRGLLRRPMPVLPLQELRAALVLGQRLLGLDLGEKTIGVAVSDSLLSVATAVSTIRRKKLAPDLAALRQIMTERNVGGLVIGLPLNMDGSEGPRCQSVRQFARNLLAQGDLPVAFWDERLSTMAVTRPMLEADLSRGKRARAVDTLAATYILQGALDALGANTQK